MRGLPFAGLVFLASGCSSSSNLQNYDVDAGRDTDADVVPGADATPYTPHDIPAHVFAVHDAHMPLSIGDLRVCPFGDDAPARPNDNRVPRSSYPGVAAGGFAELENPGMWKAPFALDAYGLGMAEGQLPIKCSSLTSSLYVKLNLPPMAVPAPGILAFVDALGDGGVGDGGADAGSSPEVVPIAIAASLPVVPAVQVVVLSRELVGKRLIVGYGPLDGQCPTDKLYDGPATFGEALSPLVSFTPPNAFDVEGVKVCTAPMNGKPSFVTQTSWADLQVASVADALPSSFYGRQALFVLVLLGDTGAPDPAYALHAVMIPFDVTK